MCPTGIDSKFHKVLPILNPILIFLDRGHRRNNEQHYYDDNYIWSCKNHLKIEQKQQKTVFKIILIPLIYGQFCFFSIANGRIPPADIQLLNKIRKKRENMKLSL